MLQTLDREETLRRGLELYEAVLPSLQGTHDGEFVVFNLESGEYVLDPSAHAVSRAATARFGDAPQLMLRVGGPAAYHLGWQGMGGAE